MMRAIANVHPAALVAWVAPLAWAAQAAAAPADQADRHPVDHLPAGHSHPTSATPRIDRSVAACLERQAVVLYDGDRVLGRGWIR